MKDKDFITSKFKDENITAPESLSEANIKAALDKGTNVNSIIKIDKNKRRIWQPLVAAVACFALVIGTFASVNAIHDARVEKAVAENKDNGIVYFSNYDELENFVGKMELPKYSYGGGILKGGIVAKSESVADDFAVMNESSADGVASAAPSHSSTYKQVAEVDEADIVKTDGEYIYFIDETDSRVIIYSAKDGKTELASKEISDDDNDFTEMFLDGDRLYVIGTSYSSEKEKTFVKTFDISNKGNIRELDTYEQSGYYSTSRMVDGCIYLISTEYSYDKKYIPYCTTDDGDFEKLDAKSICAFECCTSPSYAIIGAIDTDSGNSNKVKTKAIMGGADNIYCNTEHLYLSCADYRTSTVRTNIIKYSLDGIDIKEKATGNIRGYVNDQWAFDEKDGYLRVAVTANRKGVDINNLYILDKNLERVGSVGGYAKNEHIEAVKYIGDMAYVITYETTDPLFIIDLSNPEAPEIKGEVKIDGFSTNLVPVGEDKLMGIGYSTEENEWGEARNGVKIVLFDISNASNPKVLDEKVYKDADSTAQYTHKAILQNSEKNYLAIPMNFNDYDQTEYYYNHISSGAVVFTEKGGKIKIIKEQRDDDLDQADRLVYIDDYIYTIDTFDNVISSFKVK